MAKIHLTTLVNAPVKRVFNLSRSINLHRIASANTFEKFIEGKTTGLFNENESITWQSKHFLRSRKLTSKITNMGIPHHFTVQMVLRGFKSFQHDHYFKSFKNGTFLIDIIVFESSYWLVGKWVEQLFITRYLKNLILRRNEVIKQYSETAEWQAILDEKL